jgi:hypothetical protein
MQVASISRGKRRPATLGKAGAFASAEIPDQDPMLADARQLYLDAIHIPAALIVLEDGHPRIAACNAPFERVGGKSADGDQARGLITAVDNFLAADLARHDLDWHQPGIGGRTFRVHLSRLPILGEHTQRALVSLVDRTAEVETARSLRAEMLHDSLTGLPSRAAWCRRCARAICSRAWPVTNSAC